MSTIRKSIVAIGSIPAVYCVIAVGAAAPPGAMPGDEAMTCAQIAAELAPYASQMMGLVAPMVETQNAVMAQAQARAAAATPAVAGLSAAATASTLDPTGVSSKAVGQAESAFMQEEAQRSLAEVKPYQQRLNAQANQVLGQAQQLQSNARLQRLTQLAQEKRCQ